MTKSSQKPSARSSTLAVWLAAIGALAAAAVGVQACGADPAGDASASTGTGPSGCSEDCSANAAAPVCDSASGTCVPCLPSEDVCPTGQYCSEGEPSCLDGCADATDCVAPLLCNATTHKCVGCVFDTDCDDGMICTAAGECATGCSEVQPCDGGLACCDGGCFDTKTSVSNCGACGNPCAPLANATVLCQGSACVIGPCDSGFVDCNLDPNDGCEWDLSVGPCACTPGETMPCYTGPIGTEGIGACVGGTSTCNADGASWGSCVGEIKPTYDECGDSIDQDCTGAADDPPDADGDGWNECQGDCCDSLADGCGNPDLVNPGAFEVAGNTVDDDCNGAVDDVLANCDSGLPSGSSNPLEYAKAMDLCASTVESPPTPAEKTWGVITGWFYKADGTGTPASTSRSIRPSYGSGVTPLAGSSLAVLSTGVAAAKNAPNNTSPTYAAFQGGKDQGITSGVPSDWLAANGNNFPNAPGCPDPQGGTVAHDPIMLKLRVRVPTNAFSFDVSALFYSSEYPEWVCSAYNDFFLALLDSTFVPGVGQSPNPADKNLAFYDPPPAGGSVYPVGVNLAFGNTGLFTQCLNGSTGCGGGAVPGTTNTCAATSQLTGTGFDVVNPPPQFAGDPGYCGGSNLSGGATGWVTTSGNVVPGEIIELRFTIWDTGDQWYDSLVLLDNFVWSVNPSTPGTHQ